MATSSSINFIFSPRSAYALALSDVTINFKHSLITLNLQNADFDEIFDEFSQDLVIQDPSQEEQCQQVREFLGFEPNYIDDYEICREYYDIKCDYENGNADALLFDKPRGGKIPDFQGFEFKPASFEGLVFSASEFVGFEFQGFEPSANLTFQELGEVDLEDARVCECRLLRSMMYS